VLFQIGSLNEQETKVIERIEEVRQRLRYVTSEARVWGGLLRRVAFAKAIQGSNSIEGFNVGIEDAVAAADNDEPQSAAGTDWAAVTGYRDAMTYVLQLADDPHFRYSEDLLRGLHFLMMRYDMEKRPGRWRPGPIFVRGETARKVVYEGPDAGRVPSLMAEFAGSLNRADRLPALVRAAMAHLNLSMIHPFSDGNGRMARIVQTLVLAREGILSPQFCSIEEYLGRYTRDYYDVLAQVGAGSWHPERDATAWIRFCLRAHYRQANALIRRTEFMQRLVDEIEVEVNRRRLNPRMILPLAEAAFGLRIRNSGYRTVAAVSLNLASRDLKQLADAGLLTAVGERRGRVYVASDELMTIRKNVRVPRLDDDPFATDQDFLPGLENG
jgi:Fic family protein